MFRHQHRRGIAAMCSKLPTCFFCRSLKNNLLDGTIPTKLSDIKALKRLCVEPCLPYQVLHLSQHLRPPMHLHHLCKTVSEVMVVPCVSQSRLECSHFRGLLSFKRLVTELNMSNSLISPWTCSLSQATWEQRQHLRDHPPGAGFPYISYAARVE